MKHILVLPAYFMAALAAYGQATIVFNNRIGGLLEAPIFGPELSDPLLQLHGNDASGVPAEGTVYSGARLQGPGFTAELWSMPLGETTFEPVPGAKTTFRTTLTGAGFIIPPNSDPVINDVLPGERAMLELRVWDNQGATVNDWLTADGLGLTRGISTPFLSDPLGGVPTSGPPLSSPNMTGLRSFNIAMADPTVPEPKSMAATAIGLLVFASWWRRTGLPGRQRRSESPVN